MPKALASVIGEEELSASDKQVMEFGRMLSSSSSSTRANDNRTIEETLDLGWELLSMLPREELDRVDDKHAGPLLQAAGERRPSGPLCGAEGQQVIS